MLFKRGQPITIGNAPMEARYDNVMAALSVANSTSPCLSMAVPVCLAIFTSKDALQDLAQSHSLKNRCTAALVIAIWPTC